MSASDLPDFDDMMNVADSIKHLMLNVADLERQIKEGQAKVYQICTTDKKYFENGKAPSMAYIKSLYEYTGLDGELIPLRQALAMAEAELDFLKAQFDMMKMQVDVYRTESANKRASTL